MVSFRRFPWLVIAIATRASADPLMVSLDYTRDPTAEGCPDAQSIRDGVAAQLGRDPFTASAATTISTTIRGTDGQLQATITVRGNADGQRELRAPVGRCEDLASAVELAIAIGIDELGATHVHVAPREAEPTRRVEGAVPVLLTGAEPPRTQTTVEGQIALLSALGATPGATIGIGIGVVLRRGAASLAVEGRADVRGERASVAGGSIEGELLAASLLPCVHRGHLAACVVATAGVLRATAHDLPNAHAATSPYVAVGGRLAWLLETQLATFALQLEVAMPIERTELRVGMDAVWTTGELAGIAGIAVRRRF
jgi:hypothetical protein